MSTPQISTTPTRPRGIAHGTSSSTLADVLERILDKGLVIAGDVKIKIVDIELLTIQIRLLICSVDKAREMGIDWWSSSPYLNPKLAPATVQTEELNARIARLEALQQASPVMVSAALAEPVLAEPLVATPVVVQRYES
ncbi:MAG: gas vesicle protein [Comamonadaceae bacterium]